MEPPYFSLGFVSTEKHVSELEIQRTAAGYQTLLSFDEITNPSAHLQIVVEKVIGCTDCWTVANVLKHPPHIRRVMQRENAAGVTDLIVHNIQKRVSGFGRIKTCGRYNAKVLYNIVDREK
jgi:hypothetical protein